MSAEASEVTPAIDDPYAPEGRTWSAHLAGLEDAVGSAHAALHDTTGDPEVVLDDAAWTTDVPQGPLQPADADRVVRLLRELEGLIAALDSARSRTARELQLHRRLAAGRSTGEAAVYVDGRC